MPKKFEFFEAYRKAQPETAQEILEARQKSHQKLSPAIKSMGHVYSLCQLAFDLSQEISGLTEWFQPAIKEFDPRFSLSIDKAEAARIASLLMRDLIARGSPQTALAVIICSFGGQRTPVDSDLLVEARDAIAEAAKQQRIVAAEKKIVVPAAKDIKAELDAIQQNTPATTRAALDALIADARTVVTKTASSANEAHQSLREDMIRLAEEVDMLWWHIGDWSEQLETSRAELPKEVTGVVSGIEIGRLVRRVPGPLGVYGILHRTLGRQADKKIKLKTVIDGLGNDGVSKLASTIPSSAWGVFPVHSALLWASEQSADGWVSQFERNVGALKDFELANVDLAIQAFRERVLVNF